MRLIAQQPDRHSNSICIYPAHSKYNHCSVILFKPAITFILISSINIKYESIHTNVVNRFHNYCKKTISAAI